MLPLEIKQSAQPRVRTKSFSTTTVPHSKLPLTKHSLEATMKKNIAIFGSYNATSVGDTLILRSLIQKLQDKARCITVYCFNSEMLSKAFSTKDIDIKFEDISKGRFGSSINILTNLARIISTSQRNYDEFYIGGGNLLMDYYRNWPPLLLLVTIYAKIRSKKTIFIGVGAGPISTAIGRSLLKLTLKLADSCIVRDKGSYDLLSSMRLITLKKLDIQPDLAISYPSPPTSLPDFRSQKTRVGLNLCSWMSKNWPEQDQNEYRKYLNWVIDGLSNSILNSENFTLTLYSTNENCDRLAYDDFLKLIETNRSGIKFSVETIEIGTDLEKLEETISTLDLNIASRLHACIAGLIANKPTLGIIYQPKVKDVLEVIGLTNSTTLGSAELSTRINNLITNPAEHLIQPEKTQPWRDKID